MGGERKGKDREGKAGGEKVEGGNGREERASHTAAALGLTKPRAGSDNQQPTDKSHCPESSDNASASVDCSSLEVSVF